MAQALRFGQIGFAAAQSFLACAQLSLRPPQLGDVLQHAKLAQRPSGLVPRHVALAMDNSHIAVGADYPVFNVIPRTVRQQGSRSRVGRSRPVLGVFRSFGQVYAELGFSRGCSLSNCLSGMSAG